MENISRRKFIKYAVGIPLIFGGNSYAFNKKNRVNIVFPEKPFEYYVKNGKQKGGRVLIVGGIHGNEIGAYKASDILIDTEIERGQLIIVPRSNFTSILANKRGYNGDMNRKFAYISKKDPDYKFVENLKQLILTYKPDVVLSLHDGYGFHSINKNHWGQCIVIDEVKYKNFDLYKIAKYVSDNVNKQIKNKKYRIPVYNTQTFSSDKHKEQRKALTGWCLKNDIPAFCLEASKQLPSLYLKIKTHFMMIQQFLEVYNVKIKPSFDYLLQNLNSYLEGKYYEVIAKANGKYIKLNKYEIIKLPKGSRFEIKHFRGTRGTFSIGDEINLNWKDFYIRKFLTIHIKDDYKKIFSFAVKVV